MSEKILLIALASVEVIVDGKAQVVAPGNPFIYDGDMDLKGLGAARDANEAEAALFEKNEAAKAPKPEAPKRGKAESAKDDESEGKSPKAGANKRENEDV